MRFLIAKLRASKRGASAENRPPPYTPWLAAALGPEALLKGKETPSSLSNQATQATQTSRAPSPIDDAIILDLLYQRLGGIHMGGPGLPCPKEESPEVKVQAEAAVTVPLRWWTDKGGGGNLWQGYLRANVDPEGQWLYSEIPE